MALGGRMNRRSFISRTALVGAAAVAAPTILAARPKHDEDRSRGKGKGPKDAPEINPLLSDRHPITRQETHVVSPGGPIGVYLTRPSDVEAAPGILVIQENQGLQPYQRDIADALATNGYIAVVPDLLSRDGGTGIAPASTLGSPTDARHIEDLTAALDLLRGQAGVGEIGVIGFCFGGALTWRLAIHSPDLGLSAVVPCYGAAPADVQAAAGNISAAVFAAYAEDDTNVNATRAGILAAMDAAGVTYDTKTYPGTRHAFHNHTREDRYNPKQAQKLWKDALEWFEEHLN
jgi:carboxymethylenebutenolidase